MQAGSSCFSRNVSNDCAWVTKVTMLQFHALLAEWETFGYTLADRR